MKTFGRKSAKAKKLKVWKKIAKFVKWADSNSIWKPIIEFVLFMAKYIFFR